MTRPLLAVIAHSTDGAESSAIGSVLEPGVHLRWGFRRELGFPIGGFCVFRRESRMPQMLCGWFDQTKLPKGAKDTRVTIGDTDVVISADTPLHRQKERARWLASGQYSILGIPIPPNELAVTTIASERALRLDLPLTPCALVEVLAETRTRITAMAYSGGRVVAEQTVVSKGIVIPLHFAADRIDVVKVQGKRPRIVRVCIAQDEPCREEDFQQCFSKSSKVGHDEKEWQLISKCPICLPVSHPDYLCPGRSGCDEATAVDRLPKDKCAQAKYGGANLSDLLDAVRTVVDRSRGPTMGSRFMAVQAEAADCAAPGSRSSDFRMSGLDMLLTASIDPAIARVLGLYVVDNSSDHLVEGHTYDYKIVGHWPEGTLWSLDQVVGFDDRRLGSILPPGFKHEGLTFVADSFSHVVPVMTNFAGATHALQLQEDIFNWSPILSPSSPEERRIYIRFEQPIGEVQVYARQKGGGLTLNAYHAGVKVPEATAFTVNPDALLAVHAPAIDAIEIVGDLQYLFQIHYGFDYLPHGTHCYTLYGVRVAAPNALEAPSGVSGTKLPGVTRKRNDCQPLLTGQIADTRYPVGVRWESPVPADGTILSKDPLLFHIERRLAPDGPTEICTRAQPRMVIASEGGPSATLSVWPSKRHFFTDVVPHPDSYQYRVSGIDIFGRRSEFGPWSRAVPVSALPPPPPASVTAKWLDPKDPNLTDHERSWILDDGLPGALIRWEWLDGQDRQSPFVEKFHIAFERGWLNHLLGSVGSDPTAFSFHGLESGNEFTVEVEFDRILNKDVLAGMIMAYKGVPCRILANTQTQGRTHKATLTCATPQSGVPSQLIGETVAIPLNVNVRAKVEHVEAPFNVVKAITLLVIDLRGAPVAGFSGAVMSVGGHSWPLRNVEVVNVTPDGVWVKVQATAGNGPLDVAVLKSLQSSSNAQSTKKTVTLQLPAPKELFLDYGVLDNWPIRVNCPVPAEGTGLYGVFVRQAEHDETPGRTTISARCHSILIPEELLPDSGLAYGQAAVASEALEVTRAVSSPATFVRVSRVAPEPPANPVPADDFAPVYASPPDYYGHSSYGYRWPWTGGESYIVYRALDETLFAVNRSLGSARSQTGYGEIAFDWGAFLANLTGPNETTLRADALAVFIARSADLDYAKLSNRLLQILASFPDVEEAFTRLNGDPIAWNNPEYIDGTQCLYKDDTLPAQGTNRYFYRVRAMDALGNAARMSISTPPVHLRPGRPQTPVITRVTSGDRKITLAWASNREPNIKEYRVYRAGSVDDVLKLANADALGVAVQLRPDEWINVVQAESDPSTRPPEVECFDLDRLGGADQWYVVVAALESVGADVASSICSAPSVPIAGRAYDLSFPPQPRWQRSEWVKIDASGIEHSYADPSPGTPAIRLEWSGVVASEEVLVERSMPGQVLWAAVANWQPGALTYRDEEMDETVSYRYRLRVRRANGNSTIGPVADVRGN